jgi:hypothetical protein
MEHRGIMQLCVDEIVDQTRAGSWNKSNQTDWDFLHHCAVPDLRACRFEPQTISDIVIQNRAAKYR